MTTITLTTDRSRSYGRLTLLIDGEAYAPTDVVPGTMMDAGEIVLAAARAFVGMDHFALPADELDRPVSRPSRCPEHDTPLDERGYCPTCTEIFHRHNPD